MNFRTDIQGLRAIAVLPVLFYHAGFDIFGGGFLGVDIFFVISGYLITTIIIQEIERDRFSFLSFYERRARRILPMLFFVILASIPFAWMWMLPSQFIDFALSVAAVAFFVSNILFWQQSGYFAPAAEEKPLLHTWSLAIEEQYYILIPIFLILLWRGNKSYALYFTYIVAFISFVLCVWGSKNVPSANFYLIPTRAWELLVGSICAMHLSKRDLATGTVIPTLGLLAILVSVFVYDDGMPFPSYLTLLPVLGTAAIIMFNNKHNIAGKILGLPIFVGIGTISYSAYLWHQPLFAFAKIRMVEEPGKLLLFCLILISILLSIFTWKFVEVPFRMTRNGGAFTRPKIFGMASVGTLAFMVFGVFGYLTNGADFRTAPIGIAWSEVALDDRLSPNAGLGIECIEGSAFADVVSNPNCRTNSRPKILLWGDSYAMHLAQALKESQFGQENGFIQLTITQCAPVPGISTDGETISNSDCIEFNDAVLDFVSQDADLRYVMMSSQYNFVGKKIYDRTGNVVDNSGNRAVLQKLDQIVEQLRANNKVPVFVTPPPANVTNLGQCLAGAYARDLPLSVCDFPRNQIAKYRIHAYNLLESISGEKILIDLRESLCDDEICFTSKDGNFLFSDTGHLAIEGSAAIGRSKDPFLVLLDEIQ